MKPFEGFDRLGDPIEGGSLVPKKGNGAVLEHDTHVASRPLPGASYRASYRSQWAEWR